MQRKNMGQLVSTNFPGGLEHEARLDDSRRHCFTLGKDLLVSIFRGGASVRSLIMAGGGFCFFFNNPVPPGHPPNTAAPPPNPTQEGKPVVGPNPPPPRPF